MSEPARGLLFVPIPPDEQEWNASIILRVFTSLEAIPQAEILEIYAPGDISQQNLSREQIVARVAAQEFGRRTLLGTLAGFAFTLYIARTHPPAACQSVDIDVNHYRLSEIEGDPMRVDAFAAAWAQLCELMGAEAAYFSASSYINPDLLINEGLDTLQRGDIPGFINNGDWWRSYLNPQLAAQWSARLDLDNADSIEVLPSGALLIARGRGRNPQTGDWDASQNLQFLLVQIERRLEISGTSDLIDLLHGEEKRLLQFQIEYAYIYHHLLPLEHEHNDYRWYGARSLNQIIEFLDDVRATWACALERPSLVGTLQFSPARAGASNVIVPVVAREGREWILATLLYPSNQLWSGHSECWTELLVRALELQEAAQVHPLQGEAPVVIVFCWHGVSAEVRAELITMGVQIERADHLPLLVP